MNEEKILINVTPSETRVAWVKESALQEVWIERENKKGLVGNIYYGKVERVLPGMQAAFVNIGLEKTGFLHVSDICSKELGQDDCEDITKLLRPGLEIMVQVVKNPISSKGARLTMLLTIPSNFLVFLPAEKMIGVSQKIKTQFERDRLKNLVTTIVKKEASNQSSNQGFIIRTSAEGADFHELRADVMYLEKLWVSVQERAKQLTKPGLVFEGLPLFLQVLRDSSVENLKEVQVDSVETYKKMKAFSELYAMEITSKLIHYAGEKPIFDLYSVETDIQQALERRVNLKSGGYLIFDQTEAMTTIDVNTGAFVGHKNLEETIFKTNLEATQTIAKQLRLRNLGGIIILDLIDMEVEAHKNSVYLALQKEMAKDRVKTTLSKISNLGLIEMTRQRTRESLERILCESCHVCHSRGTVKTAETVAFEIFREITRMVKQFEANKYRVIAAESVVSYILDEASIQVAELETFLRKDVSFQAETGYLPEQFDVVMS